MGADLSIYTVDLPCRVDWAYPVHSQTFHFIYVQGLLLDLDSLCLNFNLDQCSSMVGLKSLTLFSSDDFREEGVPG